jgi:membrane associated rhomboid family serine protease
MFPLRDDIPIRGIPWVNYVMIGLCTVVFVAQATAPQEGEQLVFQYGMVPGRVTGALPAGETVTVTVGPPGRQEQLQVPPPAVPAWLTLATCMFLHGGLMHYVGNMWFLYIFGDNVEDRYGAVGYVLLYLGSGIAASLVQLVSSPSSPIPTIGASGAIAGVLGAYFMLFRHARVMTLMPLGVFTQIIAVPAPFFLGLWFVMQLVSAAGSEAGSGGVAFWAHVGGFVTGVAATWLLGFHREEVHAEYLSQQPRWQRPRDPWNR